ncbi:MAG: hypothetical protein FD169_1205 [Bacillota bacterium]|nr:MAG: hypothetical protein FD169_1205 [Bacillota bacterium]
MFQSTHPQGVRLSREATKSSSRGFQSTHPQGVRRGKYHIYPNFIVFQSTHPQGVRRIILFTIDSESCFNPRTRRGCDELMYLLQFPTNVSIHAPAGGATRAF